MSQESHLKSISNKISSKSHADICWMIYNRDRQLVKLRSKTRFLSRSLSEARAAAVSVPSEELRSNFGDTNRSAFKKFLHRSGFILGVPFIILFGAIKGMVHFTQTMKKKLW